MKGVGRVVRDGSGVGVGGDGRGGGGGSTILFLGNIRQVERDTARFDDHQGGGEAGGGGRRGEGGEEGVMKGDYLKKSNKRTFFKKDRIHDV